MLSILKSCDKKVQKDGVFNLPWSWHTLMIWRLSSYCRSGNRKAVDVGLWIYFCYVSITAHTHTHTQSKDSQVCYKCHLQKPMAHKCDQETNWLHGLWDCKHTNLSFYKHISWWNTTLGAYGVKHKTCSQQSIEKDTLTASPKLSSLAHWKISTQGI